MGANQWSRHALGSLGPTPTESGMETGNLTVTALKMDGSCYW